MVQKPFWQRSWFMPLVIAVLTGAFFLHIIFPPAGEALPGDDFEHQFYPWYHFMVRSIDETGSPPLWNPHQFLGNSVVGNPQFGLLYPPNWLIVPAGEAHIARMLAILIALHAFWAGLGMTALMRSWGVEPLAALLAGVLIGTGGFVCARIRAGHYSMITAFAWLPWVLAGYRLAVQRRHLLWAAPGGMALGMCILAGYPQLVYFLGMALAVQWVYEAITDPGRPAILLRTRQLVLIGLIGLVLSAGMWLPTWDYLPKTFRDTERSLAFANEHAMPANRLAILVIPNLFGARVDTETPPGYWGEAPYFEESLAYVGLLPLAAVLLIPRLRKQRKLWFFAALAGLGILLSLGFDGVLWLALYRWVPFVHSFRAPARALVLTSIGLVGLLALTLNRLGQMTLDERRDALRLVTTRIAPGGVIALWGGALLLTTLGTGLEPGDQADRVTYMAEQLALSGIFWALAGLALWAWTSDAGGPAMRWALALTIVIAVLDAWHIAWPLTFTREMSLSPVWREASVDVPTGAEADYGRVMQMYPPAGIPNGATWTGHQTPQGYDPAAPLDWALLNQDAGWDPGAPVNRLFGVRYALSGVELEAYAFPNTADFELIGIRDPFYFYENTNALPRAFLVERYEVEPNMDIARQRIVNGDASQGDLVLLAEDPGCTLSGEGGTATITDYQPNEVTIEAQANGPGMLVLSDQYDDDWQVEVDGERVDLLKANSTMRAVCLPNGTHTVRFVYRPWAFFVGAGISAVGWLLVIPLAAWLLIRRRQAPATSEVS
ncbi:MAG: YfhO family protein [Anaerolineae bacterium]|nr:YfhO family protein [Anaerolineae bacterium]